MQASKCEVDKQIFYYCRILFVFVSETCRSRARSLLGGTHLRPTLFKWSVRKTTSIDSTCLQKLSQLKGWLEVPFEGPATQHVCDRRSSNSRTRTITKKCFGADLARASRFEKSFNPPWSPPPGILTSAAGLCQKGKNHVAQKKLNLDELRKKPAERVVLKFQ